LGAAGAFAQVRRCASKATLAGRARPGAGPRRRRAGYV